MPVETTNLRRPASAARTELARQIAHLVELGYPRLLGLSATAFEEAVAPLSKRVDDLPVMSSVPPDDHVPFVLVTVAAAAAAAGLMSREGRAASLMLSADEVDRFAPIDGVRIPDAFAYLLADIDTGSEFCTVRPADALPVIRSRGRTPLTIAEGVALVTQRPDRLRKNKCFSLLASRCGDKRVPAIWISNQAPKLGWCWDGNPHTWLGAASAGSRIPSHDAQSG